jgi:hypothetical protein
MTWNSFKARVEALLASDERTHDEHELELEPASDRQKFVQRIKAVLAA